MKIALVHDYLNQYGGGERVLEVLMEMFPDAPIYTLLHDSERTLNRFSNRIKATSFLDFPLARHHHRLFIPLMPLAANTMTIGDNDGGYDLIISDTAGFAKGFRIRPKTTNQKPKTIHISYIHTPLRYAWEPEYINSKFETQNSKFRNLFLKPMLAYLKNWDFRAAQKPDILIANSNFIAGKIKQYYKRDVAGVIYPPVDTEKFFHESPRLPRPSNRQAADRQSVNCSDKVASPRQSRDESRSYYLAVGRLLHYKRFDLIIEAFAEMGKSQIANRELLIVGKGPELEKLKTKSEKLKANVRFLNFVSDDELRKLYNGARAFIFPQVEDFGLVAAEAQVCGTPVIAFAGGGALEIVQDGETGLFFKEQTSESLMEAVRKFENLQFDRSRISKIATGRFSKNVFKKKIDRLIENISR